MSPRDLSSSMWRTLALMAALFALTNCAHSKDANARRSNASLHGEDSSASTLLADRIAALSPQVRAKEAQQLADCAYLTSRQLARDYRVIGPPLFHNFLVNIGVRERGLCFQWARDLFVKLNRLPLQTLELHWGAARAGTWREHNCVVVTAKGQSFEEGIVLDAWRHSGHLFWSPVRADHYPWKEDEAERIRLTSKRPRPNVTKPMSRRATSPAL